MSKIYLEALTDLQKKSFPKLEKFAKLGNLVGGTALTLQFNHRRSYDFDIFLPKPKPVNLQAKVKKIFGFVNVIRETTEELTFTTPAGLKITFFVYPFESINLPINAGPIKITHWKDIALDKAHTIGRRAQYRDYVDLFFILKEKKLPLGWILDNIEKKFDDFVPEKLFLEQLIYFDDLKITEIEFLRESYTPEEIKAFFLKITRDYTKAKLK